jgi:hypothetical protein
MTGGEDILLHTDGRSDHYWLSDGERDFTEERVVEAQYRDEMRPGYEARLQRAAAALDALDDAVVVVRRYRAWLDANTDGYGDPVGPLRDFDEARTDWWQMLASALQEVTDRYQPG